MQGANGTNLGHRARGLCDGWIGRCTRRERYFIYVRLTHFLIRTRPRAVLVDRGRRDAESLGRGAFQQDLDRARWSLRFALLQASRAREEA